MIDSDEHETTAYETPRERIGDLGGRCGSLSTQLQIAQMTARRFEEADRILRRMVECSGSDAAVWQQAAEYIAKTAAIAEMDKAGTSGELYIAASKLEAAVFSRTRLEPRSVSEKRLIDAEAALMYGVRSVPTALAEFDQAPRELDVDPEIGEAIPDDIHGGAS